MSIKDVCTLEKIKEMLIPNAAWYFFAG